jgi:hypothetical protein
MMIGGKSGKASAGKSKKIHHILNVDELDR